MQKIKDDVGLCIHCDKEINDKNLVDKCKCHYCGEEDFEDVYTEKWEHLSEEERKKK